MAMRVLGIAHHGRRQVSSCPSLHRACSRAFAKLHFLFGKEGLHNTLAGVAELRVLTYRMRIFEVASQNNGHCKHAEDRRKPRLTSGECSTAFNNLYCND